MKKIILFLVLAASEMYAQDVQFLNSNPSLIYLNPSFAGSNGFIRNQFSYLNQRPFGILKKESPNDVTYLNSVDIYCKPLQAGIALTALLDNQQNNALIVNTYQLSYAQHLVSSSGKLKVIPSVQFGYGIIQIRPEEMLYRDRGTGALTTVQAETTQKNYVDLSAGLVLSYQNRFFAGVSFSHINKPDRGAEEEDKLPLLLSAHVSFNKNFSEKNMLQLFCRLRHQDKITTNQAGVNLILFNHFIGGVGISLGNSVMANLGYRHNYFNLVASYTVRKSTREPYTNYGPELQVSYTLRNKETRRTLTSFETW